MLKKALIVLLLATLTYVGYQQYQKSIPDKSVHYHAGFLVYIDGIKQDFSDFKYMNFTPCSEHSHKLTAEEEQMEKAHLHDNVGDVVHVHQKGGVWGDLFRNINYTFPQDKTILGYVNGTLVDNIFNVPISADQSIVITVGDDKDVNPAEYVPLEHIKEVEKKSELCAAQDHKE